MASNNSIMIGKLVKQLLESNSGLTEYVGTKIFPLIADANTTYPFIVYSKEGIFTEYSKDGNVEDTITFTVVCVSNRYAESLEIANLTRQTLELIKGSQDGFNITECHLTNVVEEYNEDAYIQRLTFQIKNF